MKYRPEIDGLRAVAVIPVILFHAGFEQFSGGFTGVDVFFVISGYLITSLIADEIAKGQFSVTRFYERRARRILPALFLVCFACLPFAWLWMSPSEYKDFSQSIISVLAISSNALFWTETGYFQPAVDFKPLLHTWSLAVEEQFYLLFPLLLMLLPGRRSRWVPVVVSATVLVSFLLAVVAAHTHPSANFYLIPTRMWELGAGALLALIPIGRRPGGVVADSGAALGLLMILYAFVRYDASTPFPSQFTLLPVVGTCLLILLAEHSRVVGAVLRTKVLVGVGLMSYSLYLWHQPVFAFMRMREAYESALSVTLAATTMVPLLAALTWKYVEQPFRNRRAVSGPKAAAVGACAVFLLLGAGLAGQLTNGFASATASRRAAQAAEDKLSFNYGLGPACAEGFTLSPLCRTGDDPEVLVWGDSFAMHLVDGLIRSNPDVKLIQFTMGVCGPVIGVAPVDARSSGEPDECWGFNDKVMDWVKRNNTVKYAVLSSHFGQYVQPNWRLYLKDGIRAAGNEIAAENVVATLEILRERGITPVLVTPPPNFGGDIGRCLLRSVFLDIALTRCNFREEDYLAKNRAIVQLLKRIDENYHVIWLSEAICRDGLCAASRNGTFLYRDTGHLSSEGSALIGEDLGLYRQLVRMRSATASGGVTNTPHGNSVSVDRLQ